MQPFADQLLALPPCERRAWLAEVGGEIGLEVIAAFKAQADARTAADPGAADEILHCAELAATRSADPLARPLAAWARGNWQLLHDPQQAIACYEQALAGYRAAADPVSIARLLTNLVFPYTECGRLAEAAEAADEARMLLHGAGVIACLPLLVLEQNAGWLLHNQGRYADALAAYGRALALAYQLDQPDRAIDIQVNRTITLEVFGHLDEEEATLLASRTAAERYDRRHTMARIDLNLGELYASQGRLIDAVQRLQAARQIFGALNNTMELGAVLLAEAGLLTRLGALAEARRNYDLARQLFAALDMLPQVGIALVRGAAANRADGLYEMAAHLLAEAHGIWHACEQPLWQAAVQLEQAELALAQDNPDAALALLQPVANELAGPALHAHWQVLLAEAHACCWQRLGQQHARTAALDSYRAVLATTEHGDRLLRRRAFRGLGQLLLNDDHAGSQAALEAALAIDAEIRQSLSIEELKSSFQRQSDDLLAPLIALAVAQRAPLQALTYAWQVKGGALGDVVYMASQRCAVPEHAARVAHVRERLALQRWRSALEAANDLPDHLRERDDSQIRALEDELRTLQRQRTACESTAQVATPLQVLRTMDADVLLEYVQCAEDLYVICADRAGRCRVIPLTTAREMAELLDDIQLSFQHVVSLSPTQREEQHAYLMAECLPLLQRCYAALLAPCGPFAADARLLIAPCGPLYLTPFAALHDGQRFLVEQHALSCMPCGALLGIARQRIATAAPVVIGASAQGRLDAVCGEVAAVADVFPTSVCLVDQPGSVAYLTQLQAAPAFVHVAAHSVLRDDAPIFSALHLTGELLSVEQCYDLPLGGTTLVTLSGCTTSAGLDTGGALLAFQTALFAAGASAVVSSFWPVDDQMTATWMTQFYRQLAAPSAPAIALQCTQQALLNTRASRHPAIWAAFGCMARSTTTAIAPGNEEPTNL